VPEFLLAAAFLGFAAVSAADHPFPAAAAGGGAAGLLLVAVFRRMARAFTTEPAVGAHFSPKGGCTAVIVGELNRARREVLVQAYSFTCPDIAKALIAAARRGARVKVLLDKSNEGETYSELGDLEGHGIEVLIDAKHAIAHNKVMVIDGSTVLTGSFNFTRQAEHENAENLVVLNGHPALADRYRDNFHAHREHCQPPGARKVVVPAPRHRGAAVPAGQAG
jgi:phosphatidylserine/phosphatidylglycerophosphate/cardiolipin synthase-like enzyme